MIAEIGHFALILALAVAAFQTLVPLIGAERGNRRMIASAVPATLIQLILVYVAFAALTHAYLISDFSVRNVFENSHSAKPLLYKISGVWGNHEGSMLLWVFILASFGGAVAIFGDNLPPTLKARVLAVQGSIGFAFLLFMVVASNPFARLNPVPIEGNGLNPVLQDPALAFHPPFLYAGYVGLSVAFSFAIAALIEGKVDAAWARWVRPWTLAAWMFLTIGISMGSWWAYYELGWGGWWFWDPVENASFMPWLVATALLHSAIVVEKRNALKVWTVLLSILAFSLSLLGTFLVRSGVLTSVHAFAVDPARGIFILGILCFFIGGALALFAWRAPALRAGGFFSPISREGGLVLNNLFLCAACASVLIGTLYPLALETMTGEKISVGPPYFNLTFGPIMLPLLLLVPIGALLSWKRADLFAVLQRLWAAAALAIGLGVLVLVATPARAMAGAARHGAGSMAYFWQPRGSGKSHCPVSRAPGNKPAAPCGPAALKPRHDLSPCGAWPDDHRHHRHHLVEGGAYRGDEARRARRCWRLHRSVRGRNTAHRRKLYRPRRAVPDFPRRSRNRHRCLREARIQAHGHADNRSGPASDAGRRCLCGDG